MNILVTGATGFIGSTIVDKALEKGYNVFAGVRSTSSLKYLQDPRIHYFPLDLSSDDALRTALEEHVEKYGAFHYVVHAAGSTKVNRPDDFYTVNTEGTDRLARLLMETQALSASGRLIFLSSLSVFGALHETDGKAFSETDIPQPNTHYGRSKWLAEQALARVPHLPYIILRPTGVYGPRERDYLMMFKSIKQHLDFSIGHLPQQLSFIYVDDLVRAVFLAFKHGTLGSPYIIAEQRGYTSRQYALLLQSVLGVRHMLHLSIPRPLVHALCSMGEQWGRATGKMPTFNNDKYNILTQRNWTCSTAKAALELKFQAEIDLEEGSRRTAQWYQREGWI